MSRDVHASKDPVFINIVSGKKLTTENYCITQTLDKIKVVLKKNHFAYRLRLDASIQHKSVFISAMDDTEINFGNSEIILKEFEIEAGILIFEKSFIIHAQLLNFYVAEIFSEGSLISNEMSAHFYDTERGFYNRGVLKSGNYSQFQGLLINYQKIKMGILNLQDSGLVQNEVNARWTILGVQEVHSTAFANYGEMNSPFTRVNSALIEINGKLGGGIGEFTAGESLQFDQNAVCSLQKIVARSKGNLLVDGLFKDASELDFEAEIMSVMSTSQFYYCERTYLIAKSFLKFQTDIIYVQLGMLSAQAPNLYVDSILSASTELSLEGSKSLSVGYQADLIASKIILPSKNIYVQGILSGNLIFPNLVNYFYSGEKSRIRNGEKLNLSANFIEAHGKIDHASGQIKAHVGLKTSSSTHITGGRFDMLSLFMEINGVYELAEWQCTAGKFLNFKTRFESFMGKLTAKAPTVLFDGRVYSNLAIFAENLRNLAFVKNSETASFVVSQLLDHARISTVQSGMVTSVADRILQEGFAQGKKRIEHKARTAAYYDRTSFLNATETVLDGPSMSLGGKIQFEKLLVQSSWRILAKRNTELQGGQACVKAFGFAGHLNVRAKELTLPIEKYFYLFSGDLELEKKMLLDFSLKEKNSPIFSENPDLKKSMALSGQTAYLNATIQTKEMNVRKSENSKNTSLVFGTSSSVDVESFSENLDVCERNGRFAVGNAIFESKDQTSSGANSSCHFKEFVVIKSKDVQLVGIVENLTPVEEGEKNKGFFVESQSLSSKAHFSTETPIHFDSDFARLAGKCKASAVVVRSDNLGLTRGFQVNDKNEKLILLAKSNTSKLRIENGVRIQNKILQMLGFNELLINSELNSDEIQLKVKKLLIGSFGVLGNSQSKINIKTDEIRHKGKILANELSIKNNSLFLQYPGSVIQSLKYNCNAALNLGLLSLTRAQRINTTALLRSSPSFEFFYQRVGNSIVSFDMLPRIPDPTLLFEAIKNFKFKDLNKSDIPNFLFYTIQPVITILRLFFPVSMSIVNMFLSLGYMGFYGYSFYNEVLKIHQESLRSELGISDFLPLIVYLKNIIISIVTITFSGIRLPDFASIPAQGLSNFSVADFLLLFSPILPSDNVDSILSGGLLSPEFMVSDSVRSFLGASILSPDFALFSNEIGLVGLVDVGQDFAWNETKFGHWVLKEGGLRSHNTDVQAQTFILNGDAEGNRLSVAAGNFEDNGNVRENVFSVSGDNFTSNGNIDAKNVMISETGKTSLNGKINAGQFYMKTNFYVPGKNAQVRADSIIIDQKVIDNLGDLKASKEFKVIYSSVKDEKAFENINAKESNNKNRSRNSAAPDQRNLNGMSTNITKHSKSNLKASSERTPEQDLWHTTGRFSQNRPTSTNAKVTFVTDHPIQIGNTPHSHDANAHLASWMWEGRVGKDSLPSKESFPYSIEFIAPGITITRITKMTSPGDIILISTEGSVTEDGLLIALGKIKIQSVDSIFINGGSTQSFELDLIAKNNIFLDRALNEASNAFFMTEKGNFLSYASREFFKDFAEIEIAGDALLEAHAANDPQGRWIIPSILQGGAAKNREDKMGLVLIVKGTLTNNASSILADGSIYLDAKKMMENARTFVQVDKSSSGFLIFSDEEEVDTTVVCSPVIQSKNGSVILKSNLLDAQAANFSAKEAIILDLDKVIFRSILVHNETKESASLGPILLCDAKTVEEYQQGPSFVSAAMFVKTKESDIDFNNSDFDIGKLDTKAQNGKVIFRQDPKHIIRTMTALDIGIHVGPFSLEKSFNPYLKDATQFKFSDPLFDSVEALNNNKRFEELLGNVVNTGDAAAAKYDAAKNKNYLGIVDTSIGVSAGYTKMDENYYETGPHHGNIGVWNDRSKNGGEIDNFPMVFGVVNLENGQSLMVKGMPAPYSMSSIQGSFGINFTLTGDFYPSADFSQMQGSGTRVLRCPVFIGTLIMKNGEIYLKDAQVYVFNLKGSAENLRIESTPDEGEVEVIGISLRKDWELSFSNDRTSWKGVQEQTSFTVETISDGHVKKVEAHDAQLRGKAFSETPPDSIIETHTPTIIEENGFSLGFKLQQFKISSIGYSNARDILIQGSLPQYEGVKFNVILPENLIKALSEELHPNNPINSNPQYSSSDDIQENNKPSNNKKLSAKKPENDEISINKRFEDEYIYKEKYILDGSVKLKADDSVGITQKFLKENAYQDPALANLGQNLQLQPFSLNNSNNFSPLPNINLPGSQSPKSSSQSAFSSQYLLTYWNGFMAMTGGSDFMALSLQLAEALPEEYWLAIKTGFEKGVGGPVSFLQDTAIIYANTLWPVPNEAYQGATERMNLRVQGLGNSLLNTANFLANSAIVYAGQSQPALLLNPVFSPIWNQANIQVNQTLQTKILDPLNWAINQAAGPELVEKLTEFGTSLMIAALGGKLTEVAAGELLGTEISSASTGLGGLLNRLREHRNQFDLYSGDPASPSKIFKEGFKSEGSNLDLEKHVRGDGGWTTADTAFIATSRSIDVAKDFPPVTKPGIHLSWVHVIKKTSHAIDVDKQLVLMGSKLVNEYEEQEFAFRFEIPAHNVKGSYVVLRKISDDEETRTIHLSKILIENPGYDPKWEPLDYLLFALKVFNYASWTYATWSRNSSFDSNIQSVLKQTKMASNIISGNQASILFHKFMNLNSAQREGIPKVFIADEGSQLTTTAIPPARPHSPALFQKEKLKEILHISELKENKK